MRWPCTQHFLWHLTLGGRRGYFMDGWTVHLLAAVCDQADAQMLREQRWVCWLALKDGVKAWCVTGGIN